MSSDNNTTSTPTPTPATVTTTTTAITPSFRVKRGYAQMVNAKGNARLVLIDEVREVVYVPGDNVVVVCYGPRGKDMFPIDECDGIAMMDTIAQELGGNGNLTTFWKQDESDFLRKKVLERAEKEARERAERASRPPRPCRGCGKIHENDGSHVTSFFEALSAAAGQARMRAIEQLGGHGDDDHAEEDGTMEDVTVEERSVDID